MDDKMDGGGPVDTRQMNWPPPEQPWTPAPPPRRRRRRWPFVLAFVLVGLLALLAVGDRVAVGVAQDKIATTVRDAGFGTKPDVSIKGFPFLTQVAGRNFQHVTMSARNVPVSGSLRVSSIEVSTRGVKTSSNFTSGTIGSVDGTAMIGFNDLTQAAGQPGLKLSAAGGDKVRINADVPLVGGQATARVTKQGNAIRVHDVTVAGGGGGLGDLAELGNLIGIGDLSSLDITVPVQKLPLGLTFQSLSVTSGGIAMKVTGKDVKFGR